MSILDQIANPKIADIAGALDMREQRLMRDEEKRKEIRMGQLIAQALPDIKEGSPLYELATTKPRESTAFAKAVGIPLSSGDRMQEFIDDTERLYTIAQADPRQAFDYAMELSEERKAQGRGAPQIDKFIEGMRQDPETTLTGLFLMQRSLNQVKSDTPAGLREFDGMTSGLSEEDKTKAKRIALGLDPRAVGTGTITTAVTPGLTDAVARSEAEIQGQKTAATNTANTQNEAKKSTTRSNQLLSNIQEAKKLLPKATESRAGAARDAVLGAAGISTNASEAAAQLELLSGWMVANVPRMEGPQSNIDVENYRIMAARIGDRNAPMEERMAALNTLEKLQSKYSDLNKEIIGAPKSESSEKEPSIEDLLSKY